MDVDERLRPFLPAAIVRFGYLHPNVNVVLTGTGVDIDANCDFELVRDFQLTLYRQKVYEENKDLRAAIMRRVLGE